MGSVNIMGNTDTLKIIRGKDKIKWVTHRGATEVMAHSREYRAPMEFDANDKPLKLAGGVRSFCEDCSSMLWNYDEEWAKVSADATSAVA